MDIMPPKEFQSLAIVGAGQIGTSAALAAALKHPNLKIVCYDVASNHPEFKAALNKSGLDESRVTLSSDPGVVKGAELVVLATPVSEFVSAVNSIAPYVTKDTVFTDVGSVKKLSMQRIRDALNDHLGREASYVPFHILNGNKGSGPSTSDPGIFNAPGVIIPHRAPAEVESRVEDFWHSLGGPKAKIYKMSADRHDQIFGTTSHLEHVIAFSFMQTKIVEDRLSIRRMTDFGGSVKAITRIAEAGPIMWVGNFQDNRDKILETAKHFRKFLGDFANAVDGTDGGPGGKAQHAFWNELTSLHHYAADKQSTNLSAFDFASTVGHDTRLHAMTVLISAAITANAQRIEKETGQSFADICNPSFRDGLGLVAVDPKNAKRLLQTNAAKIIPIIKDFLGAFDRTISLIETRDTDGIKALVTQAGERRQVLGAAFLPPERPRAQIRAEGADRAHR